jgi:cell division septation protein DedD
MKHSMVTLRLHKIAVIFIVIGALLLAVLLVGTGYLLGGRRAASAVKAAASVPTPAAAAPQPAVQPPPTAAAAPEVWTIRVGVCDTEDEAKTLVQQLAARKLTASIVPVNTSAGITLYTVEVGQYATRDAAGAAAKTIAADYGLQTAVISAQGGAIKAP